jgi:sulfate adenylyltransferase subunit 1
VSGLLRFSTAGSVDDGKSTLIGRLLYDSRQLLDDQIQHIAEVSRRRGGEGAFDLALLTDGLRAEREQGITIDVAYRFFRTSRRRFIIADVPGHQQYTRNMVTGASTAELAIVLVDARAGIVEQSKRHAFISALLRIPHLVLAVNKMDLVNHSQARFDELVGAFEDCVRSLGVSSVTYIPVSALNGDNVVTSSAAMSWYGGPTLLEHLETVEIAGAHDDAAPARFPVQWVVRATAGDKRGYRGYAGQVARGTLRKGDLVVVLPSGRTSTIDAIDTFDGRVDAAPAPLSVTVVLAEDVDVSRGDVIAAAGTPPEVARDLEVDLCWMSERPLRAGGRYAVKQMTRGAGAVVTELLDVVDVHSLERLPAPAELSLNDIGRVALRAGTSLAFDPYPVSRHTGSLILIDEATNDPVAAGMILGSRSRGDGAGTMCEE